MSDLIDRQDVIDSFKNCYTGLSKSADEAYYKILYTLRTLPSAEPERKKGNFVGTEYDGYADGNPVYYEWKCSECGCVFEDDEPTYNFCPNCGAEMGGGR